MRMHQAEFTSKKHFDFFTVNLNKVKLNYNALIPARRPSPPKSGFVLYSHIKLYHYSNNYRSCLECLVEY